jgi:hypothetical protein
MLRVTCPLCGAGVLYQGLFSLKCAGAGCTNGDPEHHDRHWAARQLRRVEYRRLHSNRQWGQWYPGIGMAAPHLDVWILAEREGIQIEWRLSERSS